MVLDDTNVELSATHGVEGTVAVQLDDTQYKQASVGTPLWVGVITTGRFYGVSDISAAPGVMYTGS